jgi:hypothetical protein
MKTDFFSMVMNHFQYLVADYGFSVKKVEKSELAPEIEGRIELENLTTFVTISSEQWAAGASVGRVRDDKYRFFLDPRTIHEYLSLTEADKRLVYSFDPEDRRKVKTLIHQVSLFHSKKDFHSIVEDIESQLADYSKWLRQYAEPFLRGDFSRWLEIYEYRVYRHRAEHIRSGKEEFVRTVGQNKDKRVSIFQGSLDYLEKLREEDGKDRFTRPTSE